MTDAISADVSFEDVDVWWQDEARVGQQGKLPECVPRKELNQELTTAAIRIEPVPGVLR